MTEKLKILVDDYGELKVELDALKKDADEYNKCIKELMQTEGLKEFDTGRYKAVYQVRKSESLDEEKVIEILKSNGIKGIVKTKQYVDEDALENAIYNGKLDSNIIKEINKTKITKESVALTIKRV